MAILPTRHLFSRDKKDFRTKMQRAALVPCRNSVSRASQIIVCSKMLAVRPRQASVQSALMTKRTG
ncbi:hypothetical protein JOC27_000026 [Sporolactobacillus spathodeae]|uniref:Uncharacterized protein n=1 Tax=Sporolactobacillus spathodeae TaxID=1465502 RepID=A0ABS2Q496_9BACL|nr:hypothetical protein [Sporolactobacillus spathodeae]